MKINLLREDQMTKVPHQNKEKEMLRFDDTFSGGNDDFYFQQPTPPSEEYKKPRRFRFWLFLLIFLISAFVVVFILEPHRTRDFIQNFGQNVTKVWNRTVDKVQTFWMHRNEQEVVYIEKPVKQDAPEKVVKDIADDVTEVVEKPAPQKVIRIEKPIEKQVVKETTEEKILESPPIYDSIRDDLALSRRNMMAAEFVWSKIPGGMIMDKFTISGDKMSISVKSRFPMLIQSYANVIEQHDMFTTVLAGDEEKVGEQTRVQLSSDLPSLRKEDRPERIWDLDIEWFDDYLVQAANASDVIVSQEVNDTETVEEGILKHQLKVTASGNRTSMMEFLQELQAIPAAFAVEDISSTFEEEDQSNLLELVMVYYERE